MRTRARSRRRHPVSSRRCSGTTMAQRQGHPRRTPHGRSQGAPAVAKRRRERPRRARARAWVLVAALRGSGAHCTRPSAVAMPRHADAGGRGLAWWAAGRTGARTQWLGGLVWRGGCGGGVVAHAVRVPPVYVPLGAGMMWGEARRSVQHPASTNGEWQRKGLVVTSHPRSGPSYHRATPRGG